MGLIVNPIAGMGGRVGLKGTDGGERLARAIDLGARPTAEARVRVALERLATRGVRPRVIAAAGRMGADIARRQGFDVETLSVPASSRTGPEDTRRAASELLDHGVELLLFAGGDGTARDVHASLGTRVPVLGIPTGVKMHSGVFAATPAAAGDIAAVHLAHGARPALVHGEIVDRETVDDIGPGPVRLYGEMLIPRAPRRVLSAKAPSSNTSLGDLHAELVAEMKPGRLYILGPGGSVGGIRRALGIDEQALSVAAIRDRRLVGEDLNEEELLNLLDETPDATVFVGVIGGQGSLFGRGNQQLSPRVLRRAGLENVVILASLEKLLALSPHEVHVDTGDSDLDRELEGYLPVRVAPRRSVLFAVTT